MSFQKPEQQQDQGDPGGRVRRRRGSAGADPDREPAGVCARADVQGPHGPQDPVSAEPCLSSSLSRVGVLSCSKNIC